MNTLIIFLQLFQNELVLFAELSSIFPLPVYICWLTLLFFHILIIAVLFGQTASLNYLQIIQNKLARVLLSADIRIFISDMMNTLCWDKLHERWNKQLLVIVFKCLHHNAPSYLSSQFIFTSSIHSKCTRSQSCNALVLLFWNNNQGKRTCYNRGAHCGTDFHLTSVVNLLP